MHVGHVVGVVITACIHLMTDQVGLMLDEGNYLGALGSSVLRRTRVNESSAQSSAADPAEPDSCLALRPEH